MKTNAKIFLSACFSVLSSIAMAQSLVLCSGIENTVAGNQGNGTIHFETKNQYGVGAFYQADLKISKSETSFTKKSFYGIILQAPVAKTERLSLLGVLRTGFVNEKFLVVVPSVETRVHLSSRVGVSIGAGFRHAYPSLSVKAFLKLF